MEFLINFLNGLSSESITCISAVISILLIMVMLRTNGVNGLQAYVYLALIVANIQVMKGTSFFFTNEPVPLGTLAYGTISIALSIITEFYGKEIAKKTIWIGTLSMIGFTIFIVLTLGYKPLNIDILPEELKFLCSNHFAMKDIFMPIPAILISSLFAYFISEWGLVFIQLFLKKFTGDNYLIVRTYLANIVAAFIDLLIMNYMAWILLNPTPITMKQLFISYIFAAYPFRLLTAAIAIPSIKIAQIIFNKYKP